MQATYDPTRRIYIVGDPPDPTNPANRTVDDGDIPPNWHQCFYYESEEVPPSSKTEGGHKWIRCRNLAGPGPKPSFCLLHAAQEAALHARPIAFGQGAAASIAPVVVLEKNVKEFVEGHYCRWGPCIVKLWGEDVYCEHHRNFVTTQLEKEKRAKAPFDPIEDCGCMGYCEVHLNQTPEDAAAELAFHEIVEDIDEAFCNKIGWGQLRYRRARKQMQQQETVHFKLELRGSRDEIDLFHAMLKLCDNDYPLDPFRKNTTVPAKCDNCGGYIWANAIVTASDIKKAGKQAGINVKVRTYLPASTCQRKERTASA